jgi:hypothetical protein
MNARTLAKHYGGLTPEERFRLILAAGARGDHAEQDRLANAGSRITLSMRDHAPYAAAFDELALLVFIELLEEAARYWEALGWADDASDGLGAEDAEAEEGDEAEEESEATADADSADNEGGKRPLARRTFHLALAAGFVLKVKAAGWRVFCERLNVPPFTVCERLPGFDRLQRALALAEKAAFRPEGFLRWLNAVRSAGKAKLTEVPLTVEGVAEATAKMFRKRVAWWGGVHDEGRGLNG